MSNRLGRVAKRGVNAGLGLLRLGDSIHAFAEKPEHRSSMSPRMSVGAHSPDLLAVLSVDRAEEHFEAQQRPRARVPAGEAVAVLVPDGAHHGGVEQRTNTSSGARRRAST